jgi:hypothetical protein
MNKLMLCKMLSLPLMILGLSSCASVFPPPVALEPGAETVVVDPAPAGRACKYLGRVSADVVNGAPYISNEEMTLNAVNMVKNKAYRLGANYVDITKNYEDYEKPAPGVMVPDEEYLAGKAYNCSYTKGRVHRKHHRAPTKMAG